VDDLEGYLGDTLPRGLARDLYSGIEGKLEQAQFLCARDRLDASVNVRVGIDVPDAGAHGMDREIELGLEQRYRT
jgi:hypothetical protein